MSPNNPIKPKRQKKKKPRTEVSSGSESDTPKPSSIKKSVSSIETVSSLPPGNVQPRSALSLQTVVTEKIRSDFTKHYMQRITSEFAEDLDKIRGADDFKGTESVEVLIRALRQGVEGWNYEGMKRVVEGEWN